MKRHIIYNFLIIGAIFLASCGSHNEFKLKPNDNAFAVVNYAEKGNLHDYEKATVKNITTITQTAFYLNEIDLSLKKTGMDEVLNQGASFTFFAPVNDAFNNLDKATLDKLMFNSNATLLSKTTENHIYNGIIEIQALTDGRTITMANGYKAKVTVKDGAIFINNAKIIGTNRASNGLVFAIDQVLLAQNN